MLVLSFIGNNESSLPLCFLVQHGNCFSILQHVTLLQVMEQRAGLMVGCLAVEQFRHFMRQPDRSGGCSDPLGCEGGSFQEDLVLDQ